MVTYEIGNAEVWIGYLDRVPGKGAIYPRQVVTQVGEREGARVPWDTWGQRKEGGWETSDTWRGESFGVWWRGHVVTEKRKRLFEG